MVLVIPKMRLHDDWWLRDLESEDTFFATGCKPKFTESVAQ